MEVEKNPQKHIFRHMSCKKIQRGWGSGKGQEICSEEQTHSTAVVWPKGHQPWDVALTQSRIHSTSCPGRT